MVKNVSGWNDGVGSVDSAHSRMGGLGLGFATTVVAAEDVPVGAGAAAALIGGAAVGAAAEGVGLGTAAAAGAEGRNTGAAPGLTVVGAGNIGAGDSGLAFIWPGA